jgi:Sulfotransferase domain
MRLIGAGLPRTATLTQKIALETLGVGPCYHMVTILSDLDLVQQWLDAFDDSCDWDQVFGGYQATVDWPGAFFYRELAAAYPDARVLLSVRDGDAWARSMHKTIWGALYGDTMMRDLSVARRRVDPGWRQYVELMRAMWEKSGLLGAFDGGFEADAVAAAMERHNDDVRQCVPSDRLLVWSPADGWGPLCEFLEVPLPPHPLPRVNDATMFVDRVIEESMASLVRWQDQRTLAAPG